MKKINCSYRIELEKSKVCMRALMFARQEINAPPRIVPIEVNEIFADKVLLLILQN